MERKRGKREGKRKERGKGKRGKGEKGKGEKGERGNLGKKERGKRERERKKERKRQRKRESEQMTKKKRKRKNIHSWEKRGFTNPLSLGSCRDAGWKARAIGAAIPAHTQLLVGTDRVPEGVIPTSVPTARCLMRASD